MAEMAAFAERFGFVFAAHEKGDANRSARVEPPFDWSRPGNPKADFDLSSSTCERMFHGTASGSGVKDNRCHQTKDN